MRRDRSGPLESGGIVDAGLVGQRSDKADTGCGHEQLADPVTLSKVSGAIIEFPERLVEHQPGVEQWQQGVRQLLIGFDDGTHCPVEPREPKADVE